MPDNSPRLGGQARHLSGREPALTGDRALLHLVEMLSAPDDRTRQEAAFALAELGDERAAGHLAALVDGEHPREVRERAALALGPVGRAALPHLLTRLVAPVNYDSYLQLMSISSITAHSPELGGQIVPILMQMFRGENHTLRMRAINAMGHIGDGSCIPVLLDILTGNPDTELCLGAAYAMGTLGSLARSPEVIDALFDPLAKMPTASRFEPEDYQTFAVALSKIGDPTTIPRALALMLEPFSEVGPLLWMMIPDRPVEEVVPQLIEAYADPRQKNNQRHIIRALARTDDERAVDLLLESLSIPGDFTDEILGALRRMKPPRAVPAVVALLKGSYRASIIAECLRALSAIDDPSVAPEILPFLAEPRVGGVVVVEMLERFRYEPAVPALVEALADPMLRTLAIRALLTIGTAAAYQALADHCDAHTLRNARPWISRDLWREYYHWRRAQRAGR